MAKTPQVPALPGMTPLGIAPVMPDYHAPKAEWDAYRKAMGFPDGYDPFYNGLTPIRRS